METASLRKLSQEFIISYPLQHKVVRDLKIVTETVGELTLKGTAYFNPSAPVLDLFERYAVDIDFVEWNGQDIKAVLLVTGALEDIEEYATRKAALLFHPQTDSHD
jgi:hypothetical protein